MPVELSWEDVGCTVLTGDAKGIKTVLQKSSGNFLPGEFVAIVGPSGAGELIHAICIFLGIAMYITGNTKVACRQHIPTEAAWG